MITVTQPLGNSTEHQRLLLFPTKKKKKKMQKENGSGNSIGSLASNSSDVDTSEFEDNSDFSQDSDDNETSRNDEDSQVNFLICWLTGHQRPHHSFVKQPSDCSSLNFVDQFELIVILK